VLHNSFYTGTIKRGRLAVQTDAVSSTVWYLGQRPGALHRLSRHQPVPHLGRESFRPFPFFFRL
jgi:hypothetical protein